MSIALKSDWFEPKSASNEEDSNASLRGLSFQLGWFAEPIFLTGDYPQIMKDQVLLKSDSKTRLVELTNDEKTLIKGFNLLYFQIILINFFFSGSADFFYLIPGDVQTTSYQDQQGSSPSYLTDQV